MTCRRTYSARRALLAVAIGCCMQWAVAQDPGTQRHYDLPGGRLVDALNVLSEQSGLQIVYEVSTLTGRSAAALRGNMTAEEALGHASWMQAACALSRSANAPSAWRRR